MDNIQSTILDQEIVPEKKDKQVIKLGNGFIFTIILLVILIVLGIFLWNESNFGNPAPVTNSGSSTNIPSNIKLNPNSNFN